jgi:succinate-semialdehyde dehydrogenase/glutarate-semialdehyde dehydrogenase
MPIATTSPLTGQLIKTFEELTDAQIEQKLQLAAKAFAGYRKTSFAERASLISKTADVIERERLTMAQLATTEMGKTLREALAEVDKCAWACRYYAEHGERLVAHKVVEGIASRSYVCYQPLGPVLAVMPWNFPFWQAFRFIAPGLMVGNIGLLKHASCVPQCALKIEEVLLQAGFPQGVFQTLLIGAKKVENVLNDPRVMAATLTGSEPAGIQVAITAARRMKKVVMELGGSDPFIVMPSADLEESVAIGVKARIMNNGQSCINAKRFIVAEAIAKEFQFEFVRRMETLKIGDPFDETTDIGPLATADGLAELDREVRATVQAGAHVLTGGNPLKRPGNFYPPTVLTDIPKRSRAYSEELFGPVACIYQVKDIDEAIHLANDTRFGLASSAWTKDPQEQKRFVEELDAGAVFINRMPASDPRLPFGGIKMSGHGRELSEHGIREFTNIKTIVIQEASAAAKSA